MKHILNNGMSLSISAVTDKIFHITIAKELPEKITSDFIRSDLHEEDLNMTEDSQASVFETSSLHAVLALTDGSFCFSTSDGQILLEERFVSMQEIDVCISTTGDQKPDVERIRTVDGERSFISNMKTLVDHKAYEVRLGLHFKDDEKIYGFGQGEEGVLDKRLQSTTYLYQHNMRIPMPTFLSNKGYGILVNCGSLMTFSSEIEKSNGELFLDCVPYLDYYFIFGPSADEIIDGFRQLTGQAVMLPAYTFGYIQSKEQYYSSNELVDVAKKYRELDIPLDLVVQDWNSWRPGLWGEKKLDPARYGNMEEAAAKLHDLHVHTMVSIWPNMNPKSDDYKELAEAGKILNDLSTYNAFDEEARNIYWRQAKSGLFDRGFDSWWCDSTEPFTGPDWRGETLLPGEERYRLVGDEAKKHLPREKTNLFALEHAKGIYQNERKDTSDQKRVLNLTRSGYISGQQYGALLWSGDISATWQTMKKQIVEGLSMGLSGYPYWTLDIGAFFVVNKNWKQRGCGCNGDSSIKWFWKGDFEHGALDMAYREYYIRFLELGVFLPVFRSHGTDTPREIWNMGDPGSVTYNAIEKNIKLRYQLLPYIYSLSAQVYEENFTIMRSLLFDFAEDPNAVIRDDEFMFGRNLLICPVTDPMYYEPVNDLDELPDSSGLYIKEMDHAVPKTRTCYLPLDNECSGWTEFHTGEYYAGGSSVSIDTPLDRIPVFVKDGSILPLRQGQSYAGDPNGGPLEIHVYPGADAFFTLYNDDGETYAYEMGKCSHIPLTWTNSTRILTIGNQIGYYDGMAENQIIKIYLKDQYIKTITYTGKSQDIDII